MNEMVICPTCDGTCEVHSHNPKCYDCKGGLVTPEKAEEIRQSEKRIRLAFPTHTGDYQ